MWLPPIRLEIFSSLVVSRAKASIIIATLALAACVQHATPEEPDSEVPNQAHVAGKADTTIPGPATRVSPYLSDIAALVGGTEWLTDTAR